MTTEVKSKIDQFKEQHEFKRSEDIFGIQHPPDYQCSEVDKIVKAVKLCYKLSNKIDRHDEDDLRSALNDINYELSGLDHDIESLRTAIEDVRSWGNAWKEITKGIFEKENIEIENYEN